MSKPMVEMRSALFVDFDNIYTGLVNIDLEAAKAFVTMPELWLGWLERQYVPEGSAKGAVCRRLLVRKCYLNPQAYHDFRPYFIKSAFDVVDCPPLTRQGKTSADIHLVMDALDILNHKTYFDEIIILSGDADFTPLLIRLRENDRRTMVSAIGYVSPAYAAASSAVISEDVFVEKVLLQRDMVSNEHFDEAAPLAQGVVAELLAKSPKPVPIATIAEAVKKVMHDRGVDTQDWFGFGSFSAYLSKLDLGGLKLSYTKPRYVYDPERHPEPKVFDRNYIFKRDFPEILPVAFKIHKLTNIPFLLPDDYAFIFKALATAINAEGVSTRTANVVRDMCYDENIPASRSQINFILSSVRYGGLILDGRTDMRAGELAISFAKHVFTLCGSAQYDFADKGEQELIFQWLLGERESLRNQGGEPQLPGTAVVETDHA